MLKKRYVLKKVLGKGGMGKVHLALDTQKSRHVAIKETAISGHIAPGLVERFKREHAFLSSINHENIVKGYDFFKEGESFYIVLEYIEGFLFNDFIIKYAKDLSFKAKLVIAIQLAVAVDVINTSGILHRDIKPSNIMIEKKSKRVKILDLGIAKSIANELENLTRTNAAIGTPEYMSPEQVYGNITPNSDIFSLGVVLYQFFTNMSHSPFRTGSNIMATMASVTGKDLPPLRSIIQTEDQALLTKLSALIEKTLEKDSSKRLQNARELAKKLHSLYETCSATSNWVPTRQLDSNFISHLQSLNQKYGATINIETPQTLAKEIKYIIAVSMILFLSVIYLYLVKNNLTNTKKNLRQKIENYQQENKKLDQDLHIKSNELQKQQQALQNQQK